MTPRDLTDAELPIAQSYEPPSYLLNEAERRAVEETGRRQILARALGGAVEQWKIGKTNTTLVEALEPICAKLQQGESLPMLQFAALNRILRSMAEGTPHPHLKDQVTELPTTLEKERAMFTGRNRSADRAA